MTTRSRVRTGARDVKRPKPMKGTMRDLDPKGKAEGIKGGSSGISALLAVAQQKQNIANDDALNK